MGFFTKSKKDSSNNDMKTTESQVQKDENTVPEEKASAACKEDTTYEKSDTDKRRDGMQEEATASRHKDGTKTDSLQNTEFPSGNKSKDLLVLIGKAIDEWQKIYHLESMPKKMVLKQVTALLKQIEEDMK